MYLHHEFCSSAFIKIGNYRINRYCPEKLIVCKMLNKVTSVTSQKGNICAYNIAKVVEAIKLCVFERERGRGRGSEGERVCVEGTRLCVPS
jgi:hypothetical protein